jgi:hypothetical protein
MARLPRYFVKDQAQHIIVRGNNRTILVPEMRITGFTWNVWKRLRSSIS